MKHTTGCRGIKPLEGAERDPALGQGGPGKRLCSIAEAARYLGRTQWAIRHLIYRGILPSVRYDRKIQLDIRDLDALIEKSKRTEP